MPVQLLPDRARLPCHIVSRPAATIFGSLPQHTDTATKLGPGVGTPDFQQRGAVANFDSLDRRAGQHLDIELDFRVRDMRQDSAEPCLGHTADRRATQCWIVAVQRCWHDQPHPRVEMCSTASGCRVLAAPEHRIPQRIPRQILRQVAREAAIGAEQAMRRGATRPDVPCGRRNSRRCRRGPRQRRRLPAASRRCPSPNAPRRSVQAPCRACRAGWRSGHRHAAGRGRRLPGGVRRAAP